MGLLALSSCSTSGDEVLYPNNDLVLVVGNAARMTCSCIFVMGMDETYCRAWTKASPDIARFSVDRTNKTVEASSLVSWSATAKFIDDKRGCILQ
jgi:hypothetical protein